MDRTSRLSLYLCTILVLASSAAAQSYTVADLGILPGETGSEGNAVNGLGQVAGCSDTSTYWQFLCVGRVPGEAFLWNSDSGLQSLGVLPGGTSSVAEGLNDAGEVVGYSDGPSPTRAFLWTQATGMTDLGTLPNGKQSSASAINSLGQIAGFSDFDANDTTVDAVLWARDGHIRDLGHVSNALDAYGLGLNRESDVVGESLLNTFLTHGFLWSSSKGMQDLGVFPGGKESVAYSINFNRIIVGFADDPNGNIHAALWDTNLKIHNLGTLTIGGDSVAASINDAGQVVGNSKISSTGFHAILWTKTGGLQDLNQLIPPGSGWVLNFAWAISASGQITGDGRLNGQNHAFLLTPN